MISEPQNNLSNTSIELETSKVSLVVNNKSIELPLKVAQTAGNITIKTLSSSIGRKVLFTGAIYLAGGTIISTFGLGPVIIVGSIIWLL